MRKAELEDIINEIPRYKLNEAGQMEFSYDEEDVYLRIEDIANAFKYPIKIRPGVKVVITPCK